jgi:hypothetical protein
MTREPDDFAVKEQILSDYLAEWEPADAREAVEAIKLDAAEAAANTALYQGPGYDPATDADPASWVYNQAGAEPEL